MTATSAHAAPTTSPLTIARLAAFAAAAAVLDLAAFAVAGAADASMKVEGTPYEINAVAVAGASIVPILLGGLFVGFLSRRRPAAVKWFGWGGLVVALLSIISPLVGAEDTATGVALAAMHVFVGGAWALALAPWKAGR
ncbi:DUF6069 family protein [Kineosporia babensis]|uniref:DUF6069 family protein n=1 Tax=Kineosporia babensis TaxID=499548 RepID=A0A9X1SY12_9ACTN|nr:DUF6069 family protein [Kineosporia babensis]MCD5315820.1 DUF6069 family protein [Kineosporia babensis]